MQPNNEHIWGQTPTTIIPGEAAQQHRVLRNTYFLLALTMIPTILGALIGVQAGFSFLAGLHDYFSSVE